MIVKKLNLENFRNYKQLSFSPHAGTTLIYGDNAQGKTNLLEAFYLFTTAKSFRTPRDAEMIAFGEEECRVKADFYAYGRDTSAEIRIFCGKRKLICAGGAPLSKTSELLGQFPAVVFSPDELHLIGDAPEARRRFLDSAISAAKPAYYGALQKYLRAKKQKNCLLKTGPAPEALSVWNEQMALEGARIMAYRRAFFDKLAPRAKELHAFIAPGECLDVLYSPSVPEGADMKETTEILYKALERKREAEIYAGLSLVGPHRDDMLFRIGDKPARDFASQGQQKTASVALKVAQASLLEEASGEVPLVLLDDVMGELDEKRRTFLCESMQKRQTVVTGTDKESMKHADAFVRVEKGEICI